MELLVLYRTSRTTYTRLEVFKISLTMKTALIAVKACVTNPVNYVNSSPTPTCSRMKESLPVRLATNFRARSAVSKA